VAEPPSGVPSIDAELWIIDGTVEVISEGHWKLLSS
jgi:hypothetical protein